MPTTGLVVPLGQSPPFAVVTSTDHSAWIIVATALGLACVLVFCGIKAFARGSLGKEINYDEICLGTATVCCLKHQLRRPLRFSLLIILFSHLKMANKYYSSLRSFNRRLYWELVPKA